jgi:hypothetical protein
VRDRRGEAEQQFLDDGRISLIWSGRVVDLKPLKGCDALRAVCDQACPDSRRRLAGASSAIMVAG